MSNQPVDDLQLRQLEIQWVPYDSVKPNDYNPNVMTYKDRRLLQQSLLEDGWTQPIVTVEDRVIVDGEQRWTVAGMEVDLDALDELIEETRVADDGSPYSYESILTRLEAGRDRLREVQEQGLPVTIAQITGGLIPITVVDFADMGHRIVSTIRHNRARGAHVIDRMAELTSDLQEIGFDMDDFVVRLGMDQEEVNRLLDHNHALERVLENDYSAAWEPASIVEVEDPDALEVLGRVSQDAIDHARRERERAEQVHQQVREEVAQREQATGKPVPVSEKADITRQVERSTPKDDAPEIRMRKLTFLLTTEEYAIVTEALGSQAASRLVALCMELIGEVNA